MKFLEKGLCQGPEVVPACVFKEEERWPVMGELEVGPEGTKVKT